MSASSEATSDYASDEAGCWYFAGDGSPGVACHQCAEVERLRAALAPAVELASRRGDIAQWLNDVSNFVIAAASALTDGTEATNG